MHDLLRWSVGRFSKLSELFGQLGDYVGQLSESDAKTQQHFVTTATQVRDLANGIVGLSSSIRHCQDEMLKSARATAKSMSDTLWQVSGTGKTVNTPLKEVIMGVSKVVSQLDGTVTKQSKSLEKVTTLLEKPELVNGSFGRSGASEVIYGRSDEGWLCAGHGRRIDQYPTSRTKSWTSQWTSQWPSDFDSCDSGASNGRGTPASDIGYGWAFYPPNSECTA